MRQKNMCMKSQGIHREVFGLSRLSAYTLKEWLMDMKGKYEMKIEKIEYKISIFFFSTLVSRKDENMDSDPMEFWLPEQ